jgi:hypothetical protein
VLRGDSGRLDAAAGRYFGSDVLHFREDLARARRSPV